MRRFKNPTSENELVWHSSLDDNSNPLTVEKVSTHIYFYSAVNQDRCLDLIKKIKGLDEDLRSERETRSLPEDHDKDPIWLHIFSPGGDLFTGMAVSDQIKQIETPVWSIVEGYCASAATYISMSCAKRFIQPSAYMLVHQHSNMSFGKYEELKDDMRLNDMLMERYVEFYVEHSNMDEDEVREILKRESWFDAEQALEKGLVDEVLQ